MAVSNNERGREIARNIRSFIAERDALDDLDVWMQTTGPKANKGVQRKKLAEQLGISTSTLNANEAANELKIAEARWASAFARKQADSQAVKSETERARAAEKRVRKRASRLEGDNTALQAENRLLRARLRKYEAVEELLQKTARAPRRLSEGE